MMALKERPMKKLLFFTVALALTLACGSARPTQRPVSQPPAPPTVAPTSTAALLGSVTSLTFFFEHQHQFDCGASGDHWRCIAPDGLVKITLFDNPITEATISIPNAAFDNKPSKYVVALLHQTGLDNSAWDWVVSQMKQPEMSKDFGDRRVITQMDSEGWLVTVEMAR